MPVTRAVEQALAVVRAACAGDDAALLYLEGLEEVLGVRAEPSADERARLRAWNAWAAQ